MRMTSVLPHGLQPARRDLTFGTRRHDRSEHLRAHVRSAASDLHATRSGNRHREQPAGSMRSSDMNTTFAFCIRRLLRPLLAAGTAAAVLAPTAALTSPPTTQYGLAWEETFSGT